MKISVNIKKTFQEEQFEPIVIELGMEDIGESGGDPYRVVSMLSGKEINCVQDAYEEIAKLLQEEIDSIYEKRQLERKSKNTYVRGRARS